MKLKLFLAALLLLTVSGAGAWPGFGQGKVAIIELSGPITPSEDSSVLSAGAITPGQVRELNRKAEKQNADAVIYEINSGGGAVVASKEVMRAIEDVEVPTVCRFRDVAASGAYLASLGCDRIVSDSASFTGSIGVKGSYLEYSGLLRKLGVEYVNVTAGRYKDTGSRYRNITSEEKELLRQKIDAVHEEFVSLVDKRRNLSDSQVKEVRTGEAFLGGRAKELGLVDSLGGRETAVGEAENLTGRELETFHVKEQGGFNFFSLLNANSLLSDFLEAESPLVASIR
ncbi:MAG: signal peptide peptidase SppA [Candidatus Nanohaloarchaea archaeon]